MKLKISFAFIIFACSVFARDPEVNDRYLQDLEVSEVVDNSSRSAPIKSDSVVFRVLDKISGKSFLYKLGVGKSARIGMIEIQLNKAFVNNPLDLEEVYANVSIKVKDEVVFSNWIFASSPANSFIHPVYEIRIKS